MLNLLIIGKNKGLETMRAVLLFLEEGNERLQNTVLAKLAQRAGDPSKHNYEHWPTLCVQVHGIGYR